jgi:hypothetical protein
LVSAAPDARAHVDVLNRSEEYVSARNLGELGPQPVDDLPRGGTALIMRLEHYGKATRICWVRCVAGADLRLQVSDVWIAEDDGAELLLEPHHLLRRNLLGRLRNAPNQSGVLDWKEALWSRDGEIDRQRHCGEKHAQYSQLVPEHDIERSAIARQHLFETRFYDAIEAAVLFRFKPHEA